jgi:hypothetical protein
MDARAKAPAAAKQKEIEAGMQEKSAEFPEHGAEVYVAVDDLVAGPILWSRGGCCYTTR